MSEWIVSTKFACEAFFVDVGYFDMHNRFMAKHLSAQDIVSVMKREQGSRSMRAFARDLGLSVAYLSDFYHGRRLPGPSILNYLGMEKVETEATYKGRVK
jgi:transcriptional regulator with XRE-family HTH domain